MIVRRMCKDNSDKLKMLYSTYESKMYAVAYSILHQSEQAEDVVQDSFVKIASYLDTIYDVDSRKTQTLILKITKTTAIDKYHLNQRERSIYSDEGNIDKDVELIAVNGDSAEDEVILKHDIIEIADIVFRQPKKYQDVLKFRLFYELSFQEIAEIVNIDAATARKRFQRAREAVCKELEGTHYEKNIFIKEQKI